jgi:hypothetical protein
MKRLGVLVAAAALGTALVASSPAEAFRGGGGFGGFRGGGFGGFRGGMFAGRSVAVTGFNRGGWGGWGNRWLGGGAGRLGQPWLGLESSLGLEQPRLGLGPGWPRTRLWARLGVGIPLLRVCLRSL